MSNVDDLPASIGQPAPCRDARPADHTEDRLNVLIGLEGLALGGCPINALDLGRTLRGRGHRVNVFAIEENVRVSLLPYAQECGFSVTLLPAGSGVAALTAQIRALMGRHEAKVVHVFAPWLGAAATVAAAGSRRRRTAVVTNWMMENVSYTPRQTPLIVGTRLLQEEAAATHRSPVWLMEPPVDLEKDAPDPERGSAFRAQTGIAADEIAAVIVSRVDTHLKAEGLGYAIRAIARLDLPRLRLVIVGDGNAFEQIRHQTEQVNTQLGRLAVVLTGAMHDPRPAYAGADVTLGMGGSALRALAHGKPLVVLGERGFARLFEPASIDHFYRMGFYGNQPNDDPVDHLAAQLQAAIDQGRRQDLGRFGLAEVRARFSLEAGADRLEQIYREALEAVPSPTERWSGAAYLLSRSMGHEIKTPLRSVRR